MPSNSLGKKHILCKVFRSITYHKFAMVNFQIWKLRAERHSETEKTHCFYSSPARFIMTSPSSTASEGYEEREENPDGLITEDLL